MIEANPEGFTQLKQFLRGAGGRASQSPAARRAISSKRTTQPTREEPELCDLCSVALRPRHRHLLEMASRDVVCACDACALRFDNVMAGRYKLIPRDARTLPDFRMSEMQWASLSVPIELAFIYYDSTAEKWAARYPSPAGVTESLLPLDAWEDLAQANPALGDLQEDVEALLINRLTDETLCFVTPIDKCYELAGLIRLHWRGFSGGDEVWEQVDSFFENLQKYARHA